MNQPRTLRALVLATLFAVAIPVVALSAPDSAAARGRKTFSFRAMTFNIRFDFPNDGKNRWDRRKEIVKNTIERSKASVILLQEDKRSQVEDLQALLPKWGFVGGGRNRGGSGERCSIGFDLKEWKLSKTGDFWLSDTPEVEGSNTWGDQYPHKATWALLEKRKEKRKVLFISTHFVEGGSERDNRTKSARVIREFLGDAAKKIPVVLGGDFNSYTTDEAHELLCDEAASPRLYDVWDVCQPKEPYPGTTHRFTGKSHRKRIDWLLVGGGIVPRAAAVDRYNESGRYPSDHFPVLADLTVR